MKIHHEHVGGLLAIALEGELDHHGAMDIVREISRLIDDILAPRVRLDLSKTPFMDSSGIAVVMGAYKRAGEIGSAFELIGVEPQPMKVLKAAGIDKIIPFAKTGGR